MYLCPGLVELEVKPSFVLVQCTRTFCGDDTPLSLSLSRSLLSFFFSLIFFPPRHPLQLTILRSSAPRGSGFGLPVAPPLRPPGLID